MELLSRRQTDILQFITNYLSVHCYPPTFREIMVHFHFKSPRTAAYHVSILSKKGYMVRARGARTLEPTGFALAPRVPILNKISSEQSFSEADVEGRLTFDSQVASSKNSFFIKAEGEQMKTENILNGDYLLICPANNLEEGDQVAYYSRNQLMIRLFGRREGQILLSRHRNDKMPLNISKKGNFRFLGKVVAIVRLLNGKLIPR
jgi:repressor LexA